jgi:hypothetical protein
MENGTDTIPEGSFRDGDDEVFISLYRVEQDDLTIGTITLLLPQLSGSFQSQITELNNDLTASDNLKFRFATDGEGNHGYLGADDSFIPFNRLLSFDSVYEKQRTSSSSGNVSYTFTKNYNAMIVVSAAGNNDSYASLSCTASLAEGSIETIIQKGQLPNGEGGTHAFGLWLLKDVKVNDAITVFGNRSSYVAIYSLD